MLQTNVREGYRITTLEVVELIEDLISYLAVAKCIRLRNAQIPKVFYEAAYSAKVKTEDLSNTLTLILSKIAQRQSSSVVSNRSTALITNKFSVASLTELAILNDANIALVDAVHYSVVIDALTMTLIKDDDDLLGTVNSYIKSRRLRARYKTEAADSRYAKASRGRTKKDKDLEDSNTSSDVLRLCRRDRAAAYSLLDSDNYRLDSSSDINSKDDSEDEEATIAKDLSTTIYPANKQTRTRDSLSIRVETAIEHYAYILYFKELLSNNGGIFANAIGIGKTRAITEVQNARAEGNAIEYNAVNDDDKLCPTKGERTFYCADPLALQFCFFSNSLLENIGRLTKEEVIEMRIDTTNAISKALAAANKLVALQSYVLGGFVIVCSFRKVDKHMFRAYNTISVTAQRTIIRKGSSYIEKRAILLPNSVTSDRIYKIEDARNIIANVKHDASEHESSYKDILEKEGLNELEASRRIIFNCFKIVKDLFTNLSKDYFLVQEARAITKSSLNIAAEDAAKAANILLLLKEVRAKILIESYKLIVQAPWIIVALIAFAEAITLTEATHVLAEICISIVYFNLDSKLELKVLGKQDVKTTS
ncbi:hypothetical protein HBI17_236160 [Parastagonospora nodorum]|nr:hypothetical protein HBI17_236160 [Parastagonospora nodorum]